MWNSIKSLIESNSERHKREAIEDWDFIMIFEARYKEEIEAYFHNIKCGDDAKFEIVDNEQGDETLVLIQMSASVVVSQAHELKILKRKQKKSYNFDLKSLNRMIYVAEDEKNKNYRDYLKFIRSRMLPQNKMIYEQEKYSVFNKLKKDQYEKESNGELFTQEEQLRAKYNFLLNYAQELPHHSAKQDAYIYPFADIMKHAGFKQLQPIHKRSCFKKLIFEDIKSYVGSNNQTYFDFIGFMQQWLVFPMIVGLLTVFFNIHFEYTADDSPGDFIYAFAVMIWSILFITKWENNQKWHKVCEQTGYSDQWSEHQNIIDRSGCSAKESRITGQKQHYVPILKRFSYYFVSIFICLLVLLATLVFMVISLNARGFIDVNHKFLYFEQVSGWAAPGGIFDSSTGWGQIPNLIHVIVTNGFDESIYRPLVKKFTKYEKHLNPKTHENSIIIKYFIYEYIITFADLFYIAFVRMDIVGLREQLLSLFFIDIIRRMVAQLLIPKIKSKYRSYVLGKSEDAKTSLKLQAVFEVNKEDYEPFDEYLEIVTNFGYLVMISSCFPLAPTLILIAHSIETLQDKYKIIHIFKRKLPQKYVGMGYWNNIMIFLCYTSIITNIMLFAFSSHQIVSFFPKIFQHGKDILLGNTQISDIMSKAAESILSSVMNTTSLITETVAQNITQMDPVLPFQFPMVQSFVPPAEEHQVEFVTILFIIEHVFLLLFLCLRNILSRQESQADILVKRRDAKRKIKKHLQKDILADICRDEVVSKVLLAPQKKEENPLLSFFTQISSSAEQNQESPMKKTDSTYIQEKVLKLQ